MLFTRRTIPNVFKALCRFLQRPQIVPREVYIQRLTQCYGCDQYVLDSNQCGVCTCFVTTKAMLSTESCPHPKGSKWP